MRTRRTGAAWRSDSTSGCIAGWRSHRGSSSILSMDVRSWSQSARLAQKICALGRMPIRLSSDPAGTTSRDLPSSENGKRGPAIHAEALCMSCPGKPEHPDMFLARQPGDARRGGKEICRMSRAAILAAARAVTKEEALELSRDMKLHRPAQALTGIHSVHSKFLWRAVLAPLFNRWFEPSSLSMRKTRVKFGATSSWRRSETPPPHPGRRHPGPGMWGRQSRMA